MLLGSVAVVRVGSAGAGGGGFAGGWPLALLGSAAVESVARQVQEIVVSQAGAR